MHWCMHRNASSTTTTVPCCALGCRSDACAPIRKTATSLSARPNLSLLREKAIEFADLQGDMGTSLAGSGERQSGKRHGVHVDHYAGREIGRISHAAICLPGHADVSFSWPTQSYNLLVPPSFQSAILATPSRRLERRKAHTLARSGVIQLVEITSRRRTKGRRDEESADTAFATAFLQTRRKRHASLPLSTSYG